MRICAKCGEWEEEVAFVVEWRGQDVCSCCLDSEPDYWQHEAAMKDKRIAELEGVIRDLGDCNDTELPGAVTDATKALGG